MASVHCTVYAGISYGRPAVAGKPRRMVEVRAETVNPDIRKTEDKVVDSVLVSCHRPLQTRHCVLQVLEVQDLSPVRWNIFEAQQSFWA